MEKETPKSIEEKYNEKMKKIFDEVDKKDKETKLNKNDVKSLFKGKFKEISDVNTDEAFEISFKVNAKLRKKLMTCILLVVLISGSIWIKYSSGDINEGNHETPEEINSLIHMRNVLKYPNFDDIINHKNIFEKEYIYAEAIVKDQVKESDNCLKLEVTLSAEKEETAYLYYFIESKDLILKNEKISFIGKLTNINSNKRYIEVDAIRIDTGNGLFSEKDIQKLASLYTKNESTAIVDTITTTNVSKYGSGYKNYCFDITKQTESNFPNKFRVIDALTQSDIIDSMSNQGEVYSRIDINESGDTFIKTRKDFKNSTFSIEFYDVNYNKIFDKAWKNVHTNDKFAYDYISSQGKFYINIENVIYVFDEKTGEETKIDVAGKGYIDVDYKGNIYYVSLEDDGFVAAYTNKGEEIWKEYLVPIKDEGKYDVQSVTDIKVVNNSKVLISFEASKVLEDRKESPNRDFLLLKSKFGTRINDTLED